MRYFLQLIVTQLHGVIGEENIKDDENEGEIRKKL
jgi:hypothetical protein